MDEAEAAVVRYWCHMCSRTVNPIVEVEMMKCPLCQSGFVEEMNSTMTSSTTTTTTTTGEDHHPFSGHYFFGDGGGVGVGVGGGGGPDSESDRALSLWAPILLGMMSNPRRRRRFRRRMEFEDEDDNEDENDHNNSNNNNNSGGSQREGETELDRELESIIRRRRRSSATILQLLRGIRAGMLSDESDNPGRENRDGEGGGDRDTSEVRDRERVILINPFNQTIIVQGGPYDPNNPQNQNYNPIGSLGDYFIGPGLDLLLQHLAENDPNRYGTPPAQKEAVEAMPTVTISENLQCSVCLEDFEIGSEAKEMPCKHKFHSGCILPWLELHSSCPVCRYQLPSSDESKVDSEGLRSGGNGENNGGNSNVGSEQRDDDDDDDENGNEEGGENGRNRNESRFSMPFPWLPSSWFSSSGNGSSTSTTASSSPTTNAPPHHGSQTDEN